jgi:transcriptional regulator with XRE-family HTH domain
MKPFERISNPREIRRKLRMNQQEFWSRIGVTQSGGSRYESGRTMPKPVRELLRLVHIEGIELAKAKGEDFEVVSYLKQANPKLYRTLRKAASTRTSTTSGRTTSTSPGRSSPAAGRGAASVSARTAARRR